MDRLKASRLKAEMLRSLSDGLKTKPSDGEGTCATEETGVTEKIEDEPKGDEKAKDAEVADGHDHGEGDEEEDPEAEDPPISPKDDE